MEKASDYLVPEMGAETHIYQSLSLTAIVEPMTIMGADPDRVIAEAITLHLDKLLVPVPTPGQEVTLNGYTWEVDSIDTRGVLLAIGMTRYKS